ncbi:plasminogen-binding N-terminal domain-containing protein [Helicobacter cynogastricus]|uniref:plasminogen-binding N-terminal domain-containing protein n=1 Tax=Helicobacter cynogastricus TaxID=329937 RepID=UPI001F1C68D1|nr:plasminogen-binding N-terminal domain-containing protein [Helicobacter cynogastricus]
MFRFLWFFLCVGLLGAQEWSAPLKINIDAVDSTNKLVRFQAYDLKVGESGYILAQLTDYNVIAAQVEILHIENGVAIARYAPYSVMHQRHLPTPRMTPKKGYLAIFREFNHQAFLIAPDAQLYEKIKDDYKEIEFTNSDLLVSFLNGFDPSAHSLRKACDLYSVGLLFIVSTEKLNILDCQSFAILESKHLDTSQATRSSTPFYSRVEGIDKGTLGKLFGGGKSKHYFSFYDTLLKEEAQKALERALKKENRAEFKEDIKQAKSKAEKKALKEKLKEELKEDRSVVHTKSQTERQEEQSLDASSATKKAKEAQESKAERKAKIKAEKEAERARKKAAKEAKKRAKEVKRQEQKQSQN